jgi:hypothetical protein
VVVSIKNSGNVDLVSWTISTPSVTGWQSGSTLTVGSQRSFSTTLVAPDPWTFSVSGETAGGSQTEDVMVIEGT